MNERSVCGGMHLMTRLQCNNNKPQQTATASASVPYPAVLVVGFCWEDLFGRCRDNGSALVQILWSGVGCLWD